MTIKPALATLWVLAATVIAVWLATEPALAMSDLIVSR